MQGARVLATGPQGSPMTILLVFLSDHSGCNVGKRQNWKQEDQAKEASVVTGPGRQGLELDSAAGTEKSKLSNTQGAAAGTWGPECQSKGDRGTWGTSVATMRNTNLSLARKSLGI